MNINMKEKSAKRILRKLNKKIVLGFLSKSEEKSVKKATEVLLREKKGGVGNMK